MRKCRKTTLALCLILILFVSAVSGCSGSSRSFSADMTVSETAAAKEAPGYAYDAKPGEAAKRAAKEMGMAEEVMADTGSGNGLTGTSGFSTPAETARKLIRTVHLNVETDTFEDLLNTLQTQITALGGYIQESNVSGNSIYQGGASSNRHASLTARIPASELDSFLLQVEEHGNVTNRSESTEDVTLQYSDLESRKKSLTIEQDRIWELLEKADTLEAVISLEQRLSEIRYELESMESQLRLYDNQVEYSTIYLNIHEVTTFTPVEPESMGEQIRREFMLNLQAVGRALTNLIVWLITTSPVWLIPVIILIFVLIQMKKRSTKAFDRLNQKPKQNAELFVKDEEKNETTDQEDSN